MLGEAAGLQQISKNVVEEDREADGDHQALLGFPSNRCEFTANGAIWREAFHRYSHRYKSFEFKHCADHRSS